MTSRIFEPADVTSEEHVRLETIRKGQRLMIFAFILSFVGSLVFLALTVLLEAMKFQISTFHDIGYLILAVLVPAIVIMAGVYKMARGLRISGVMTALMLLFTIVWPINLIAIGLLSERSSALLKSHGYKVGLLGAKARGV